MFEITSERCVNMKQINRATRITSSNSGQKHTLKATYLSVALETFKSQWLAFSSSTVKLMLKQSESISNRYKVIGA